MAFYVNPRIRPTLVGLIDAAEVSLCVTQCYVSDEALVKAMVRAVRDRGVQVGMVVDHGQTLQPASRLMPDQLRRLGEWGIEIRTYSPTGGATALMHAKSWLADDCVAALGSANATKNSMELCYEMVTVTRSLVVTRELRGAFDALWADSSPLDLDTLPDMQTLRRSRS